MAGTCDGYVKYKESEVDRSDIMQEFRDNQKKKIKNGRLAVILDFISAKICHGLSLYETLHFVLYS